MLRYLQNSCGPHGVCCGPLFFPQVAPQSDSQKRCPSFHDVPKNSDFFIFLWFFAGSRRLKVNMELSRFLFRLILKKFQSKTIQLELLVYRFRLGSPFSPRNALMVARTSQSMAWAIMTHMTAWWRTPGRRRKSQLTLQARGCKSKKPESKKDFGYLHIIFG